MTKPSTDSQTVYERPVELLQNLIRFDTTNPPGDEEECVAYINGLLTDAGFDTVTVSQVPHRPNLVTRLAGDGAAAPLLLYGHVDVVTTANQEWTYPPFEARIEDGYVWGRGAVDMKGGVAMMLSAILRAKAEEFVPAGDIVLAVVSDEEGGGDVGAKYLVEKHPEHFAGVRFALGELGGFALHVGGKKFYAIQVAEKQMCRMKAIVHGPGGHGSMPMRGGAMAKVGEMLQRLDRRRLPAHITPAARQMIETMASALPPATGFVMRRLLNPAMTDRVLSLLGNRGEVFDPVLHNTANATIINGGNKVNVIPSEIIVELDGRLLPGYGPNDIIQELQDIVGDQVEFELVRHDPGPGEPDMGLFPILANVLREADPLGMALPVLVPGVTDARFFSRLGIQTYGYTPMNLPRDFAFMDVFHAADERVPVEAVDFGSRAMYQVLRRYGRDAEG